MSGKSQNPIDLKPSLYPVSALPSVVDAMDAYVVAAMESVSTDSPWVGSPAQIELAKAFIQGAAHLHGVHLRIEADTPAIEPASKPKESKPEPINNAAPASLKELRGKVVLEAAIQQFLNSPFNFSPILTHVLDRGIFAGGNYEMVITAELEMQIFVRSTRGTKQLIARSMPGNFAALAVEGT